MGTILALIAAFFVGRWVMNTVFGVAKVGCFVLIGAIVLTIAAAGHLGWW
jgi:hypothetical protein